MSGSLGKGLDIDKVLAQVCYLARHGSRTTHLSSRIEPHAPSIAVPPLLHPTIRGFRASPLLWGDGIGMISISAHCNIVHRRRLLCVQAMLLGIGTSEIIGAFDRVERALDDSHCKKHEVRL